jgi:NADH-quinone oxidoreductase subunit N
VTVLFAAVKGPDIDWAGLSPIVAFAAGSVLVLLVGLAGGRAVRRVVVPALTLASLAAALGLTIWQWGERKSIISGALAVDDLAMYMNLLFIAGGAAAVLLSLGDESPEEAGRGEHHALLLASVMGMSVLAASQNLVTLFLGLEVLSIPLYVLCASRLRREPSLESGLKYLIVGSVGSATLLYGLALVYGATGSTDFSGIAAALDRQAGLVDDPLTLTGIGLVVAGLAFKASAAPFHQWTPDVYQGAPTPITAFMAVATKAAALGIFLRFFDVALIDAATNWAPIVSAVAAISIVVGNAGALTQSSLKRLMAWSSVAQAGYMLAGVVVASEVGIRAVAFYLAAYLFMNLAAFAVIVARERETPFGDDIRGLAGIGATRPVLAWPMTLAMFSLAGLPATAGFMGKFFLISASVDGRYTWLGVLIVVGSMISLVYYLRVVATMWLSEAPGPAPGAQPAIAGGSPEADPPPAAAGERAAGPEAAPTPTGRSGRAAGPEVVGLAALFAAATLFFGIIPSPLVDLARDASHALGIL